MIIQPRGEGVYRLFTQHDHGLQCGALERALNAEAPSDLWGLPLALTIALHDMSWLETDDWERLTPEALPWDAAREQPHDFISMPSEIKAPMYARGIQELGRMHPYMGVLLNAHYSIFFPPEHPFHAEMDARAQHGLVQTQGWTGALPSSTQQREHVHVLRFLDQISLYACMRAPGANLLASPPWLTHEVTHAGVVHHMRFHDPDTLVLTPTPFAQAAQANIPYRELRPRAKTPRAWLDAWHEASTKQWGLRVQ